MIPNKAFQAIACATPLITADTPAARELLTDGHDALLVPPGDPVALAAAVRRLAGDRVLADAIGAAGRGDLRGAGERGRSRRPLARVARAGDRRHVTRPRALLSLAVCAFAAGMSALAMLQQQAFETGRFDVGNLTQAVWSTAHGRFLEMTDLQGVQFSRLGAHFDPLVALLAPLWWLWPSPDMLLVVQAVGVALGAVPVFLLARKHLGGEWSGLCFALVYLLYPPTQWLVVDDFHPVALATPLLLGAIWFLDEDRLLPFALCAVAACLTKEQVGLVVAMLGIWHAFAHGRRRAGLVIFAAGAIVAVIATAVIIPHYAPGGGSPFAGRYDAVGGLARRHRQDGRAPPAAACSRSRSSTETSATSGISSPRSAACRCSLRSSRSAPCPRSSSTSSRAPRRSPRSTTTTPRARSPG